MIVLSFSQVVATFLRRRRPMEPATGTESGRGDQQVMSPILASAVSGAGEVGGRVCRSQLRRGSPRGKRPRSTSITQRRLSWNAWREPWEWRDRVLALFSCSGTEISGGSGVFVDGGGWCDRGCLPRGLASPAGVLSDGPWYTTGMDGQTGRFFPGSSSWSARCPGDEDYFNATTVGGIKRCRWWSCRAT